MIVAAQIGIPKPVLRLERSLVRPGPVPVDRVAAVIENGVRIEELLDVIIEEIDVEATLDHVLLEP